MTQVDVVLHFSISKEVPVTAIQKLAWFQKRDDYPNITGNKKQSTVLKDFANK